MLTMSDHEMNIRKRAIENKVAEIVSLFYELGINKLNPVETIKLMNSLHKHDANLVFTVLEFMDN